MSIVVLVVLGGKSVEVVAISTSQARAGSSRQVCSAQRAGGPSVRSAFECHMVQAGGRRRQLGLPACLAASWAGPPRRRGWCAFPPLGGACCLAHGRLRIDTHVHSYASLMKIMLPKYLHAYAPAI